MQTIYAQAELTNLDLETLVILDNVFATNELAISKTTNITGSEISMHARDKSHYSVVYTRLI